MSLQGLNFIPERSEGPVRLIFQRNIDGKTRLKVEEGQVILEFGKIIEQIAFFDFNRFFKIASVCNIPL